jgi:hypothetical protein
MRSNCIHGGKSRRAVNTYNLIQVLEQMALASCRPQNVGAGLHQKPASLVWLCEHAFQLRAIVSKEEPTPVFRIHTFGIGDCGVSVLKDLQGAIVRRKAKYHKHLTVKLNGTFPS